VWSYQNLQGQKTKKVPWHWDEEHQKAFDDVKAGIAQDAALAYPNYSKGFDIYADISSKQMSAVITQGNRPIAFFKRKLSVAQHKYSITKIELLTMVETLNEFEGILWGQLIKIKTYTEHKNLIPYALWLTSDWVYHRRLLLEEYGLEIMHTRGILNTVTDARS
jgi:hypothetical protein